MPDSNGVFDIHEQMDSDLIKPVSYTHLYLWPYLVINTKEKQLLAVGLKMFNGQYSTDYGCLLYTS